MRRIATITKKGAAAAAGDTDATISVGTLDYDLSDVAGVLGAQLFGSSDEGMPSDELTATALLDAGTSDEAYTITDILGTGDELLGTQDHELTDVTAVLGEQPFGSTGASWSADSTIDAEDEGTGSRVDIAPTGGDATWQNPTNAESDDASNATITLTGQLGSSQSFSDELRLASYGIGGPPSGWSTTGITLTVRHSWEIENPGLDLVSTADFVILVRYTDATEDTVFAIDQGDADRGALADDTYDLTTRLVTEGKTLDRVMFQAVCTIAIAATGTTKAWTVDHATVNSTFTRTGIT